MILYWDNQTIERIYQLIGKLQEDRIQAQKNIKKSQKYQKKRHEQNLKEIIKYKIGDLVLLYRILSNGAYKLRTLDRKILKKPINSDQLKLYYQKLLLILQVIIED
ncbi:1402_t:CDS:2 [Dentiscutata erythropus]|uniref:1402_t:CDS:1 n=1 Tax=Dentiscutata erythropus TaxID=1348616 RepID=A0A9N9BHQ4_9GLOM|nr:1402_t:CDS:2 [Dentiscutata erythropus]